MAVFSKVFHAKKYMYIDSYDKRKLQKQWSLLCVYWNNNIGIEASVTVLTVLTC